MLKKFQKRLLKEVQEESGDINQIVIIDNGAYTIKVGFYTDSKPKIIPNCIAKVKNIKNRQFIGDEIDEIHDCSGMYFVLPFNRGYCLNWEKQRIIWDYIFQSVLKLKRDRNHRYSKYGLVITEPAFNFPQLRKDMIRIMYEDYGFGKLLIVNAPQLSAFSYLHEKNLSVNDDEEKEIACLVVDSGYSFTHVVPFVNGDKITRHIKRLDIGGKALTNHLKDIISYRQLYVMEETFVVNQMKEDCCFVSLDFWKDLDQAYKEKDSKKTEGNEILRHYILPDYATFKRGFVQETATDYFKKLIQKNPNEYQLVKMNNERFQVPEILFNPYDAGVYSVGIVGTILMSVYEFDPRYKLPDKNISNEEFSIYFPNSRRARPRNLKELSSGSENEEEEEIQPVVVKKKKYGKVGRPRKSILITNKKEDSKSNKKVKFSDELGNGTSKCNGVMESIVLYNGILVTDDDEKEKIKENDSKKANKKERYKYDNVLVQPLLYKNILLIGGNTLFPNYKERIEQELRSYCPEMYEINITKAKDPITHSWYGGQLLCTINEMGVTLLEDYQQPESIFNKYAISKKEYMEKGLDITQSKFDNFVLKDFSK